MLVPSRRSLLFALLGASAAACTAFAVPQDEEPVEPRDGAPSVQDASSGALAEDGALSDSAPADAQEDSGVEEPDVYVPPPPIEWLAEGTGELQDFVVADGRLFTLTSNGGVRRKALSSDDWSLIISPSVNLRPPLGVYGGRAYVFERHVVVIVPFYRLVGADLDGANYGTVREGYLSVWSRAAHDDQGFLFASVRNVDDGIGDNMIERVSDGAPATVELRRGATALAPFDSYRGVLAYRSISQLRVRTPDAGTLYQRSQANIADVALVDDAVFVRLTDGQLTHCDLQLTECDAVGSAVGVVGNGARALAAQNAVDGVELQFCTAQGCSPSGHAVMGSSFGLLRRFGDSVYLSVTESVDGGTSWRLARLNL